MARMARVVVPGVPHHVTQRGNRRQTVFFCDKDYETYIELVSKYCLIEKVGVWAYCLMPNHVHLILNPENDSGLARAIGEAHRRYTRYVNFRENWKGYLWQGRFASFPMDEKYLHMAVRYVELNPVKAGLVDSPEQWKWSSASAHIHGEDDELATVAPMLQRVDNWSTYLSGRTAKNDEDLLRLHERTGRPLGSGSFIDRLEKFSNRTLRPLKPGPKKGRSN